MQIRPLQPSDIEPLHAIYSVLIRLMPHPLFVSVEQFARELTTTRFQEDEFWNRDADLPLVAERAGEPVAFVHASFLERKRDRAEIRELEFLTGSIGSNS